MGKGKYTNSITMKGRDTNSITGKGWGYLRVPQGRNNIIRMTRNTYHTLRKKEYGISMIQN